MTCWAWLLLAWLVAAILLGLLLAPCLAEADRRRAAATADPLGPPRSTVSRPRRRPRRRDRHAAA